MKSSRENVQSSGEKPLQVFLDANTIISGLIFEGNEALLLKLGRMGLCSLVTTPYVVDEVARALRAPEFRLSEEEITLFLSYLNASVRTRENPKPEQLRKYLATLRDKKDVHVLSSFRELKCEMLVTGDRELLSKVVGAKTTRQALEILLGR